MKKHMAVLPLLPGDQRPSEWAVCTIYAKWEHLTSDPKEVTCKNCLKMMEKVNSPFLDRMPEERK